MKRITLMAALLGSVYFANAQVGIGTSTPATASNLDITATNKGILIPRVSLTGLNTFGPITGAEVESLLVYNTSTVTGVNAVNPGFYYWVTGNGAVPPHWERIVNQTQLDEAISNVIDLQGDVANIIALLKVAFPSNNLVDPSNTGDTFGGGMVFTPGTTPKIEYVYFDATAGYVKKDITADIKNIIKGVEAKTLLVKTNAANTPVKQYYLSETYIQSITDAAGVVTMPTQAAINGWVAGALPTGVYEVDIVAGVSTNLETILDQTTTILLPGSTTTYYTVEEYIKYISSKVDGNVIYKNIGNTTTPNWVFQYWDAAANAGNGAYVTINIMDLIGAGQSRTLLVKTTDNSKQYYLSETYIVSKTSNNVYSAPTPADIDAWTVATIPTGVYAIDFINGVVKNFNSIINSSVTVNGNNYTTVEKYIEEISKNATEDGVTKIVYDIAGGNAHFEKWNTTTNTWETVVNSQFKTIVTENETDTNVKRSENNTAYAAVTADPKGLTKIAYEYNSEDGTKNYINVTADILYSVTNNQDIRNAITNILNAGGNVYFTRTAIAAGTPVGQLAIPADSFYTVNPASGVKEEIMLSGLVVNAIVNATTVQKQNIKNALGDVYSTTNVTNTGDTWIDGGKIYKGIYTATVTGGTANVSNITLAVPTGATALGNVIGIKILNATTNTIINTATTNVALTGNILSFKIGTGNMYNVLSDTNLDVKVIVEFSAK